MVGAGRASQPGQRIGQGLGLGVAVGTDQHHRRVGDLAGHQFEDAERGRVRPVQILDDDQHRSIVGLGQQAPGDGVVEREPGCFRREGFALRDLGEHAGHIRGRRPAT